MDFIDELLDAVLLGEDGEAELPLLLEAEEEGVDDPVVDVDPTVGVATLVPEDEEDPVDAAKAFPETRSPTRTVAMPTFPMAMEMDLLESLCIMLTPCLKLIEVFWIWTVPTQSNRLTS